MNVMVSPWPFLMWGMDVIGPITLKASNGHRFIFVVIDYFTKWVEAASYASVTKVEWWLDSSRKRLYVDTDFQRESYPIMALT